MQEKRCFSLTREQQAIWTEYRLKPGATNYNVYSLSRIDGCLDVNKFREVEQCVAEHFQITHVQFIESDGRVMQYCVPTSERSTRFVDISASDHDDPLQVLNELTARPFDLTKEVSSRFVLLKVTDRLFYYLLFQHHICTDAFSAEFFLKALSLAYNDGIESMRDRFPQKPVETCLRDLSRLETDASTRRAREYWRERLRGSTFTFDFQHSKEVEQSSGYDEISFEMGRYLHRKIKKYAKHNRTTPFLVIGGIINILLYRYWNQDDITIAYSVNTRPRGYRYQAGNFVKVFPLRTQFRRKETLFSIVEQITRNRKADREHQALSILDLTELQRENNGSHSARLNIAYSQTRFELDSFELEGVSARSIYIFTGGMRTDLDFAYDPVSEDLSFRLRYNTGIFSAAFIRQLADNLVFLTDTLLAHPEADIDNLRVINDDEWAELQRWNETTVSYPTERTIVDIFDERVESTPGDIGVIYRDVGYTFYQINRKVAPLAAALQRNGVERDTIVAVCAERSLYMIIGILAVLKAGGAYCPIDPRYPKERIEYILDNSASKLILLPRKFDHLFESRHERLYLDDRYDLSADTVLAKRHSPRSLAYIIYTSGSTGLPKGAMIEHRNLINTLYAKLDTFPFGKFDTCCLNSNFVFDASVLEIFRWIVARGRLVVLDEDDEKNPIKLLELIQRHVITHYFVIPSVLRMLVDSMTEDDVQKMKSIRYLKIGGEVLSPDTVVKARNRLGRTIELSNVYGPSETCVCVTRYRIPYSGNMPSNVPIGKPLANTRIYVLDDNLLPCPIGRCGNIYIAGNSVGRGYINDRELTISTFLPDPFKPGEKMYRTGDTGRWLFDGNIEFIGRTDDQVKIRGYRVELAEIQRIIERHPLIDEAVVRIINRDGNKIIAAYLKKNSTEGNAELDDKQRDELRRFIALRLPGYMVPSVFLSVDRWPKTPGGKIDRRRLPVSRSVVQRLGLRYPSTDAERTLERIWKRILRIDSIATTDSFFGLGGDSLSLAQLSIDLRNIFHVDIPPGELIQNDVFHDMMLAIQKHGKRGIGEHLGDGLDVEAETTIPSNFCVPIRTESRNGHENILLTGATGFLGSYLVYELLNKFVDSTLFCLVRAESPYAAMHTIRARLKEYGLWTKPFGSRIVPIVGDLEKPRLGLTEERFHDLGRTVDAIFHNGASVSFLPSYNSLKAANVSSTRELVELAVVSKLKVLHYISTIGIFDTGSAVSRVYYEDDILDSANPPWMGYAQTKYISERYLRKIRAKGVPVNIYRPGRLTGAMFTPTILPGDAFCHYLKGIVQLGYAPSIDNHFDLTPVDFAAKSIVRISTNDALINRCFHILNPQVIPHQTLIDTLNTYGYSIKTTDFAQWLQMLQADVSNPLMVYYPLLSKYGAAILGYRSTFDIGNMSMALREERHFLLPKVDAILERLIRSIDLARNDSSRGLRPTISRSMRRTI